MQQRTTGRDYTKSSQLFTNKYYSTIASKLKLTLFEILIKLETSNVGEQHSIILYLLQNIFQPTLNLLSLQNESTETCCKSCLRMLVLLNHVPLARPIAKHLSKGFRVSPRKKKRKGSRIDDISSVSKFLHSLSTRVVSFSLV